MFEDEYQYSAPQKKNRCSFKLSWSECVRLCTKMHASFFTYRLRSYLITEGHKYEFTMLSPGKMKSIQ